MSNMLNTAKTSLITVLLLICGTSLFSGTSSSKPNRFFAGLVSFLWLSSVDLAHGNNQTNANASTEVLPSYIPQGYQQVPIEGKYRVFKDLTAIPDCQASDTFHVVMASDDDSCRVVQVVSHESGTVSIFNQGGQEVYKASRIDQDLKIPLNYGNYLELVDEQLSPPNPCNKIILYETSGSRLCKSIIFGDKPEILSTEVVPKDIPKGYSKRLANLGEWIIFTRVGKGCYDCLDSRNFTKKAQDLALDPNAGKVAFDSALQKLTGLSLATPDSDCQVVWVFISKERISGFFKYLNFFFRSKLFVYEHDNITPEGIVKEVESLSWVNSCKNIIIFADHFPYRHLLCQKIIFLRKANVVDENNDSSKNNTGFGIGKAVEAVAVFFSTVGAAFLRKSCISSQHGNEIEDAEDPEGEPKPTMPPEVMLVVEVGRAEIAEAAEAEAAAKLEAKFEESAASEAAKRANITLEEDLATRITSAEETARAKIKAAKSATASTPPDVDPIVTPPVSPRNIPLPETVAASNKPTESNKLSINPIATVTAISLALAGGAYYFRGKLKKIFKNSISSLKRCFQHNRQGGLHTSLV